MTKRTYTKEQLEEAVKNNRSYASVLKALGLTIWGSAYEGIKRAIKENELDTSHFLGRGHLKGKTHNWTKKRKLEELLKIDGLPTTSFKLKNRLLKENLLENKCQWCGLQDIWNKKPINLQLDHINGKKNDNRIENLRLLCPNCHSQTDTFCGKSKHRKL